MVTQRVPSGELSKNFELPKTIQLTKNAGRNTPRRFLFSAFFAAIHAADRNHNGLGFSCRYAEPREQPLGFLWGLLNPGKNSLTLWLMELSELTTWSLPPAGRISELTTVETKDEPARSHHF